MINTDPFKRLMVEKELSVEALSALTQIDELELKKFYRGAKISRDVVETLCRFLRCQPCDLIEYSKSETKGHWEWVANLEN